MSVVELTLQDALAKKKILEKRLSEVKTQKLLYVAGASKDQETIAGYLRNEVESKMQSNFNSVQALIINLRNLKAAINKSNAVTEIEVAGETYTIADAIARIRSLDTERDLYSVIANQYKSVINTITRVNNEVQNPDNEADYLSKILGPDSKKNIDLYESLRSQYRLSNILYLIDPNNLEDQLPLWQKDMDDFESQVHNALVASNISTTIKVEFYD